jgi:uncharacterized protein YecE (DUF72 family)
MIPDPIRDGKIHLGTSGWSYNEWIGVLYETSRDSKLRTYSHVFSTAEIDSTFYAYPSKGTIMGWLRYVNPDFVFTAKLPQIITHKKKLDLTKGVDEDVKRFCQLMAPLQQNGKLGCILIQLPPSLDFQLEQIEKFFEILPLDYRFAVEFRHLSWLRPETWELLKRHNIAYVVVDEPLLPPEIHVTTDFGYFRWHGKGARLWYDYKYDVKELAPWVPKVEETAKKAGRVYGYFNNHFHGYAVENCLQVLEMLGKLTPRQRDTMTRIKANTVSAASKPLSTTLTQYLSRSEDDPDQISKK